MEIMATSDNVVRAGFTPKFKVRLCEGSCACVAVWLHTEIWHRLIRQSIALFEVTFPNNSRVQTR